MKLYGADVCPFVHRVRLGLAMKGLEVDYVAIDLANKPDWYHDVLPSGKVPLLEHDGNRIWESMILLEYLEEVFPEPALYPATAGDRARARIAIDWVSGQFIPVFYKLLSEDSQELRERARDLLERLSGEHLKDQSFFAGSEPGILDIAIYPWFERFGVLEHYRYFALEEPALKAWCERMSALPEVKAIANLPQFYIDLYARYAKQEPASV